MSGFQSRVRDVINQAAQTYATVPVADRGLSRFMDPSMTGTARFMQKAGYPFSLLTPQMTDALEATATAGSNSAIITGTRLMPWLIPGVSVSFELLETLTIDSVSVTPDGNTFIKLTENIIGEHVQGTLVHIRGFVVTPAAPYLAGAGAAGAEAVELLSPFILVPGDVITVAGTKYTLTAAAEVAHDQSGYTYQVKVSNRDGLPAISTSTDIYVAARAAYRSQLIDVPQLAQRSSMRGPVVVDWVSGPVVADYTPKPESTVFIEEYSTSGALIADPRQVQKNDSLARFPITRDQMLFWRAAEGGVNWNGTYMELRAFASGRAHLWTPCRPPLDAISPVTKSEVVSSFAPYVVLLSSNTRPDSVVVYHKITKAVIPSSDYSLNSDTGVLTFLSSYASQPVVITYQPRLEWRLFAKPSADNVELTVTVGREPKQVFPLGAAGSSNSLTIKTFTSSDVDQLHVTARRADDSAGEFKVELGDWDPRGVQTAAVRYTISTAADMDYNWASSGLLFKSMWPTIDLLRGRLDGESLFARYLDNGRFVF